MAVSSPPLSFAITEREGEKEGKKEMEKIKRVKKDEMNIWLGQKEKDEKRGKKLTMSSLSKSAANCCSLHL